MIGLGEDGGGGDGGSSQLQEPSVVVVLVCYGENIGWYFQFCLQR